MKKRRCQYFELNDLKRAYHDNNERIMKKLFATVVSALAVGAFAEE